MHRPPRAAQRKPREGCSPVMLTPLRSVKMLMRSWFTLRKRATVSHRRGRNPADMPLRTPLEVESLEERINPNTTLNPLSGGLQILIAGGDTVNLSTANGMLVVNDTTAGQT